MKARSPLREKEPKSLDEVEKYFQKKYDFFEQY